MSDQNPYAAPSVNPAVDSLDDQFRIRLEPRDHVRANTIIKEAGQFWLAIILCLFCSAIGAVLIPIWYTVRLLQWNGLAKKYPELLATGVPPKSMQAKFKSAQWKLITGLVVGSIILVLMVLYVISFLAFDPRFSPAANMGMGCGW